MVNRKRSVCVGMIKRERSVCVGTTKRIGNIVCDVNATCTLRVRYVYFFMTATVGFEGSGGIKRKGMRGDTRIIPILSTL